MSYGLKTSPFTEELIANTKLLVANGKGLLDADESTGSIGKR
jgi:fructose-bisphosphate aldolase class 1